MIQPDENAGGTPAAENVIQVPFDAPASLKASRATYRPYGEIIQLDWTPQEQIGGIVIPKASQAKLGLPFFKVKVLAAGPDVKIAKAGTWVLLPQQVILHAKWDGGIAYFSSESKILAVVEGE